MEGHDTALKIEATDEKKYDAYYLPSEGTIFINENQMKQSAEQVGINLDVYSDIVFFHELGHALDTELSDIYNKISHYKQLIEQKGYLQSWANKYAEYIYKAELNAWENAEGLIKESYLREFTVIKEDSLKERRETLELEKKILKLKYK